MESFRLMILRVREELFTLKLPIIHDISVPIRSIDDRTSTIAIIGGLWQEVSTGFKSDEAIAFDRALIQLSVSTQNNPSIDLIHKLRDFNQLLLRISFRFEFNCSRLSFWEELAKARSRWRKFAEERKKVREEPALIANVLFYGCVRENPLLTRYEGHSEASHTVVARGIDVTKVDVHRTEQ